MPQQTRSACSPLETKASVVLSQDVSFAHKTEAGSLARLRGSGAWAGSEPAASMLVQQEFKDLRGIFLPDIRNAEGSGQTLPAGLCQRGLAGGGERRQHGRISSPPSYLLFTCSYLIRQGLVVEGRAGEPCTVRGEAHLWVSASPGSYLGLTRERQAPQLTPSVAEGAELQQTPPQ